MKTSDEERQTCMAPVFSGDGGSQTIAYSLQLLVCCPGQRGPTQAAQGAIYGPRDVEVLGTLIGSSVHLCGVVWVSGGGRGSVSAPIVVGDLHLILVSFQPASFL